MELDDEVKEIEEPSAPAAAERAFLEAAEESAETRKNKRKIYKGRTVTAGALQQELARIGALPVQPMSRKIPGQGKGYELPPTFILTKFAPGYAKGHLIAHYYHGPSGASYRSLPEDFEFNVLEGKRGVELASEWDKAKTEKLHLLSRKIGCTIGADPEIFAEKKGGVYPAWNYAGSKAKPDKWSFTPTNYTGDVYWDGFQAEFTTPANITCLMQMSDAVHAGLAKVHDLAGSRGAKLTLKSVYEVNPDVLAKCKDEHVAFGCSPSKNAYGLAGSIKDGREVPYRFAGGHIHFGLNDKREATLVPIVRILDKILGVACVSLFANFDNPIRRQFYGQPGEYRTPPHGLEYRVLSNAWLSHPLIFHMVFDLARAAAGLVESGYSGLWQAEEQETIETILHHDVPRARAILARNSSVFRGVISSAGGGYQSGAAVAERIWTSGMESAVNDPEDIAGNWRLGRVWNHGDPMFSSLLPRLSSRSKV